MKKTNLVLLLSFLIFNKVLLVPLALWTGCTVDARYGEERVEREGRQPAAGGRTDYLKTATPGIT